MEENKIVSMPPIGDKAPEFKAVTIQGNINFLTNWRPGDDVIVQTAGSCGVAKERMENKTEMHCYDWYF